MIDDADPGITGQSTWYRDADGDGYGSSTATRACSQPTGHVSGSTDCNDANAAVSPGATETCNHVDDDCDGSTDEGFDADGDGIVDCDEINYTITWTATGDDVWTGYVDGSSQGSFGGWNTTNTVTTTLNSGNHVLGAYVQDTGAAIAGWLAAVYVNGTRVSITGDGSWVYSTSGGSGWSNVAFNDSAWSTPAVCNASQVSSYWGTTPTALTGIGARWVWSSTNCTVLGSVYFRYEFNLP